MTQELAIKFFNYDEESGLLSWKRHRSKNKIDTPIGSISDTGCVRIKIGGKNYAIHRLIWLMKTGKFPDQVGHIDHNRSNNAWDNLREVDYTGRARNMRKSVRNTSGVVGVSFDTNANKWRASIGSKGTLKFIGLFDTLDEATKARKNAEHIENYHPNHGAIM